MAVNSIVHINEHGLPLNANEWLEKHHECKSYERSQMILDLGIEPGSFVVDAGCGPGLWTPLLAQAVGLKGQILGVDISADALVQAQKRSNQRWYRNQVQYKQASLEKLPVPYGSADLIFSANVSQYLADAPSVFAAMGPYLRPGGRLVIKDIDFGTMRFSCMDPALQQRVFQARAAWENVRVERGYTFEDSWVGSKLANYLRQAGFRDVQERPYQIVRTSPLPLNFRFYLQGIAEWFVSEDAPFLASDDVLSWLQSFFHHDTCILDNRDFVYEEVEYLVSGVWDGGL